MITFPDGDIVERPSQLFFVDVSNDTVRMEYWLRDASTGFFHHRLPFSVDVNFQPGFQRNERPVSRGQSFDRINGLQPGAYEMGTVAFDADGNRQGEATRLKFSVLADTQAPTLRILTPVPGAVVADTIVELRFESRDNLERGSNITYVLENRTTGTTIDDRASITAEADIYRDFQSLTDGRYRLTASVVDENGNVGPTRERYFKVEAALVADTDVPTVERIWPANDAILATTELQIRAVYSDAPTPNRDGRTVATLRNLDTGEYLRKDGTFGARQLLPIARLSDRGSLANIATPPGRYQLGLRAIDAVGNKSDFVFSEVTIEAPAAPTRSTSVQNDRLATAEVFSIDVGPDGTVFVGDSNSGDVLAFAPNGELIETIDIIDGPYPGADLYIGGVSAASDGSLVVGREDNVVYVAPDRTQTSIGAFEYVHPTETSPTGTTYFVSSPDDVIAGAVDAAGNLTIDWEYELDPDVCGIAADPVGDGVFGAKCAGVITRVDPGNEISVTIAPGYYADFEVGADPYSVIPGFADRIEDLTFDADGNLWIAASDELIVQTFDGELIARHDLGGKVLSVAASSDRRTMYVALRNGTDEIVTFSI